MPLETITREHVIRGVGPRAVYDVVVDYACYPRIFPEFSGVRVLVEDGPRRLVEFRAKVVVELRYVLDIVHDDRALRTRWTLAEADLVTASEGGWTISGDDAATLVKYRAGMSVKAPLPRVLANKVSNVLLGTNVPHMFRALEKEALARRRYAVAVP
jgi:ribosome-associated toxin RatA of RatAB toxin-antitoxin module